MSLYVTQVPAGFVLTLLGGGPAVLTRFRGAYFWGVHRPSSHTRWKKRLYSANLVPTSWAGNSHASCKGNGESIRALIQCSWQNVHILTLQGRLKDDFCRHDAQMKSWRVTHRCCIGASCRSFGSVWSDRVLMMLECSTGELPTRVAFMHHDSQAHDALKPYAVLKGLINMIILISLIQIYVHT